MAIKCIALDLDGTTLDQDGRLPEANRKAIEDAITQGIEIVIASGRAYDTLPQEVLSIKGIGWAITSNGAAVYRVPEGEAAFRSTLPPEVAEVLVKLVAPFTPHLADELWREALGRAGFVYDQPWPTYDPDQVRADEVELAVQICGKIKGRVTVAADAPEPEVLAAAREAVAAALEGKTVKKEVYVPGRLVNIVAV